MKKRLVGLLAAGLCAASAWAAQYTLIASASDVTEGTYVIVAGQGDSAMKNVGDSKGRISAEAVTVTDGVIMDPDDSLVWTLTQDEGEWILSSETAAGTVYAAAPSSEGNSSQLLPALTGIYTLALWTIADSATAGLITVGSYEYPDRCLQKNNSGAFFACYKGTQTDVRFFKEGSGAFSVEIVPSDEFSKKESGEYELTEGTEFAHLTAVAKNGEGTVTFAWTGATWAGDYVELEGETLDIPADLAAGEYYVTVWARDSSEEPQRVDAGFAFTVVPAPQAYTVTVAEGIENGSVAVWDGETELGSPADVLEGTVLKVVATPATRSYKVESVTVTGAESGEIALVNDEFTMPAENVSVTATFAERTQTAYALVESMDDFEAGADYLVVAGTDALKNESNGVRIATAVVTIEEKTVETEDDTIVWTIAAGSEGKYTFYNAAAQVYVASSTTAGMKEGRLVADGSVEAAQWTIDIDTNSLATIGSMHEGEFLLRNNANPYFAAYKGGAKPFLFKKVGAGVFSLSLDPAADFDVPEGTEATITATAKNAQGEVTYSWNVTQDDTPGSGVGNVWTIPADAPAGGPWTVYCNATDGTSEADQSVSFSIVAAPVVYEVTVEQDLEGGRVDVDPTSGVAGTIITVTAAPEDGYRCDGITVNGEPLTGLTFELPEGGAVVSASFVPSSAKTATYTVAGKSAVDTTGEVPEGSEAAFECNGNTATQLTGGTHMTLTLSGYNGATITGLTLSMHSNGRSGAGRFSATSGDAVIGDIANAPFSDARWNGGFTSDWVDIVVPVTATVVGEDVIISLEATANSLYCQSFTIEYEPAAAVFGVALDPAEAFDVVQGEEATITATPKNAAGEVTYAWTVDGQPHATIGAIFTVESDTVGGPHEVVCTATDGGAEGVTAEASVSYTVVAPPELYTVTVADGIENGTVALSVGGEPLATPAEVEEGTEVTVAATPDEGYELEVIAVNGTPIEGTTFTVAGVSEVSATFSKVVDYATLPFLAEDTPYAGPWKNAKVAGLTSDGLDNDYGDGAGKFDSSGDWLQIKFVGTPGTLTYNLKGNGTSADCVFEVKESATGGEDEESWTTLAAYTGENALPTAKTEFSHELSADSQFVRFVYTTKDKGNVALYDVYISSSEFSVSVDKTGFELEEGTAETVTAAAKNGTEPYAYAWSSETAELNVEGAELAIPGTLAAGDYAATVTATDADGQTATADVAFTVVEPAVKYTVEIADGILNGTVVADVEEAAEGDTVTVTATPAPGFKLGSITVTYFSGENFEFTTSPATFAMPAEQVLVGASFLISNDEIFVPVESADDFEVGGEYLIVAHKEGAFTDALKNAAEGSRIGADAVSIETDGYILSDNAAIVWKIQAGAEEGPYVLFNEAAGVYAAATKNDNVAQLLEDGTDPLAQWTLDLTALPAVKIVSVSYTNRWLQRNNNTAYFATYTGTQTTPMLFKKVESLEFAVGVDKTGFELVQGEGTTVTAAAKYGVGDVTYVWSSETEALNGVEGAELAIPGTLEPGGYSATVTATDADGQTATADVAFTVVAPLPVYTVTVAEGIENGTVAVDKTEAEAGETVTVTATPADNYKLVAIWVNGAPIEGNTFAIEGDSVVSAEFAEIVKFHVYIGDGILNGTVEADKEEAEAGELVTLTVTPADGFKLGSISVNGAPIEGTTFTMPEDDALVTAEFVETVKVTFVPVESESEFAAGEEYLLVAVKADVYASALKNAASGTRIGVDEVEIAEDGFVTTDNADIVWTIRAGAEEGQYVLFSGTGGVYAAGPDEEGNAAKLVTDGTDALAQWTLDFSALPEVKVASVSYDGRWLQRNGDKNNKYFATYTGGQVNPLLFKKAGFAVGFDKEDGFTVEAGTADSITATAVRGVEPYSFVWTGDLEGEGATLAIPGDLAEGGYAVTVTATDSSEPALTAEKEISFTVVPPVVRYSVTVADVIDGGEVSVDKAEAAEGETVTVTATPDAGYELVEITVNGVGIAGDTFTMPAENAVVSATFAEIVDYATLPFVAKDTPYQGPWQNAEVAGLTHNGLGTDYGDGAAKFREAGVWMQIKFKGAPGSLTYGIKGNGVSEESGITFRVQESADGETWADLAVYASGGDLGNDRMDGKTGLSEDSRFVRFFLETKTGEGNVGIYDVYIGAAGEEEPAVTVAGDLRVTLGGTFALELGLENYAGESFAWTNDVYFGWIESETSTFWWTPEEVGVYNVSFTAMDGDRPIASETVTLTVAGKPALAFGGDAEGTVGTPVNFTVAAENVMDSTVTFLGFLSVPEGSALTDADVVLDFPSVTFTPDVAGDYGLAFSAGTEGVDYVEDVWPVAIAEPELVFEGDDSGSTGRMVKFKVLAELPGGAVDFGNFLCNFPEGSSLTEEDVAIDAETGEVSFTPDVPGVYEFGFALVGGQELYIWTVNVEGEEPPPAEPPAITKIEVDVAGRVVTLWFTGDATEVWGTDDLTEETDPWAKVEDAVVDNEGKTALTGMEKSFLRLR